MKAKSALALAALAAAALAGPTFAQSAADAPVAKKSDCFYSGNIRGFSAVDDETVNLQVGGRNDIVQVKLFAPSNDLMFARKVALISRGSSFICSGLDATMVVPGPVGSLRYPVTSIRRLDAQEVAALSPKHRP